MQDNNTKQPLRSQRYLKPKAAAEHLGISSRTLRDLAKEGRLPVHRVSARLLLFDIKDLDAFLASCRIGGEE